MTCLAPGIASPCREDSRLPPPAGEHRYGSGGSSFAACGAVLRVGAFACAVALAVAPTTTAAAGSDAGPWSWSLVGLTDLRAHARDDVATRLVPDPPPNDCRSLSVTAAVGAEASKGSVAVSGAGRLEARAAPSGGDRARLLVDELHAEYAFTPRHYVYAGRRHIVHGRSLGVNPLDVALDPVALDRSRDATRRRRETEGQDMVGFESLIDDRFALTGYWSPGDRAVLAGSVTAPQWQSDATALLVVDDRPGAGLSFSRTLGDAVLAYADVAVRRGRDRLRIRADHASGSGPGVFVVEEDDGSGFFVRSSIGASYTLDSGATFDIEYHFDANGYSSGEWNEIAGLIVDNNTALRDERFHDIAAGNLLRLSAHFARFTMRRHYGFVRMHHPGLFGRDLALETTVFHGLADHSGRMGLRVEHEIGRNLLLGVEGRWRYGSGLDEFAQRTNRLSGSIYVTVYF